MMNAYCTKTGLKQSGLIDEETSVPLSESLLRFSTSSAKSTALRNTATQEYRLWKGRLDRFRGSLPFNSKAVGDYLIKAPMYNISPKLSVAEKEVEEKEEQLLELDAAALQVCNSMDVVYDFLLHSFCPFKSSRIQI